MITWKPWRSKPKRFALGGKEYVEKLIKSWRTDPEDIYYVEKLGIKVPHLQWPVHQGDQCDQEFYWNFIKRATYKAHSICLDISFNFGIFCLLIIIFCVYPALWWRYIIWHTYFHVCCKMYLYTCQISDLYIYLYLVHLSCHILHISALAQQYQSIYLSQHLKTFKLQNCVSLTRLFNDLSEPCWSANLQTII